LMELQILEHQTANAVTKDLTLAQI